MYKFQNQLVEGGGEVAELLLSVCVRALIYNVVLVLGV